MKRLLFFVLLVFTASSLLANSPNQLNSDIEKFFNSWKDFMTQYDKILENYDASSSKAQTAEKKVHLCYKKMREACSALYAQSSKTYKKQIDSGVKNDAPMLKELESRIENLKTVGRRMKPSLDIDQQKELLLWMTENDFPQNICGESSQNTGKVSAKKNKPGERLVKTINGVDFAFRWCPPGTFIMGSPSTETDRNECEKQHLVTLTKGFWIMETEVTQKQWKIIMGNNPSEYKGDNLPIENVTWENCQEFCMRCDKLGLPVQLPTEAQWEYACRAGSRTAYSWGNVFIKNKANADIPLAFGKLKPVGSYAPNACGLYDMHGNVSEWCQDWKADYPNGKVKDPTGPLNGEERVIRGGSWYYISAHCRSASRGEGDPGGLYEAVGLRCIMY